MRASLNLVVSLQSAFRFGGHWGGISGPSEEGSQDDTVTAQDLVSHPAARVSTNVQSPSSSQCALHSYVVA